LKVANLVAEFLRDQGIKHVFCISGGASLHLIHGISDTEGITYVCPQTEQAAGFAADSYARLTGLGCALATSGPGATNLVTAIASSFYDSIPVLYLTGNVTRGRMSGGRVRQLGFQETPIVPMVKEITNYARTVMEASEVLSSLKDAIRYMKYGRQGPAVIDIPDDIQRAELNV
jgi:acetolactate synthase I/II/III large subunit